MRVLLRDVKWTLSLLLLLVKVQQFRPNNTGHDHQEPLVEIRWASYSSFMQASRSQQG